MSEQQAAAVNDGAGASAGDAELTQVLEVYLADLEAELPPRPVVRPHDFRQQRVRPFVQCGPRGEERRVVVEVPHEALSGELR